MPAKFWKKARNIIPNTVSAVRREARKEAGALRASKFGKTNIAKKIGLGDRRKRETPFVERKGPKNRRNLPFAVKKTTRTITDYPKGKPETKISFNDLGGTRKQEGFAAERTVPENYSGPVFAAKGKTETYSHSIPYSSGEVRMQTTKKNVLVQPDRRKTDVRKDRRRKK